MKKITKILMLIGLVTGYMVNAGEVEKIGTSVKRKKLVLVKELFVIMQLEDKYNEQQAKGMGELEGMSGEMKTIIESMKKLLSWKAVKNDFYTAYAEVYTENDLKLLIKFYKTKTGEILLVKEPKVQEKISNLLLKKSGVPTPAESMEKSAEILEKIKKARKKTKVSLEKSKKRLEDLKKESNRNN